VHDVAVDYYGKRLATCSSDRLIKLFAVGAGDVPTTALATLAGHEGPVWQVAWAHPKFGSILASCSYDRQVIVWREGAENEWQQDQVVDRFQLGFGVVWCLLRGDVGIVDCMH
jgi:protein transport protein SEC13